jgi:hypothetical protein
MRVEVNARQVLAPVTYFPGHDGSLTLTATALLRVR